MSERSADDAVAQGRAALASGAWSEAYARLAAADALTPLEPEDLDRLASAAFLVGQDAASVQFRTRAHNAFLERDQPKRAAASAFWLAFTMLDNPAFRAQAAGWLARAQRLVDELGQPCVEQGWLLCGAARQMAARAEFGAANAAFAQAAAIGTQFGDKDLLTMARHGQGRSLLAMNHVDAGLALLDEVMVAIAGGEIAPIITGALYCSVINACTDLFDLRRAHEWTAALDGWCGAHPDIVPFRGYCLIHRSQLKQHHGAWDDALTEARRACERLTDSAGRPEAGAAYYQLGELYRLRGEFAKADDAYRLASQVGHRPQPGLALLRASQDQIDAADAAIRLALQERSDRPTRIQLLRAAVAIALDRHDAAAAHTHAAELEEWATRLQAPYVTAVACHAWGEVLLADAQPLAALERLRAAASGWSDLDAPYHHARTRALIAQAYGQLGDAEGSRLEFEAALDVFERLGAAPDAARVATWLGSAPIPTSTALTGRELEVLRLIATGVTNRAIASRLGISDKTVARHISNIFTKLDLPSRAAATAYAYEHKLV